MEQYLREISGGSVFDPVFDTLSKTINVYGQLENIKLQSQLAKAQASATYAGAPSYPQDAQAKAQNTQAPMGGNNMLLVGLAVLVGAAALYVIVK